MKREKNRYIKRLALFLIPFILFLLVYVVTDPYMVICHYDNFNRRSFIQKNRDYVSTEMLKNNRHKYKYDSFILGSSTSLAFAPSIWKDFISTENYCYSFDASGEHINGIWSKAKYLDDNGFDIKHLIIILESNTFGPFINDIPIFAKHPEVYRSSKLYFQYASFLSFAESKFMTALITHLLSGRFYPFMNDLLVTISYDFDTITNEYNNVGLWEILKNDSIGFYLEQAVIFPVTSGEYEEEISLITKEYYLKLKEIKEVIDKHSADYRVVITPALDQISFNSDDLAIMYEIFGEEFVFDFTGINEFTSDRADYYDVTHFKRTLARKILGIVYHKDQ